jgi:hypothetical protein
VESYKPDYRGLVRDLGLILGIPFLLLAGLVAWWQPWTPEYEVPEGTDVFAVAAGTWDWEDADGFCESNPHTIAFSPDRSLMTLTYAEGWADSTGMVHPGAEYEVQGQSRRHVRGSMRGETRRTDAGDLVVWDLVLTSPDTSPDTYRWHRTDWRSGELTKEVRRCPAP